MGKKQHSKDRMFITTTEWANEWGGAKARDSRTPFKKLPFYCCAVSFTPFEDAVCSPDGHVFDILNIVPYIQKFGRNPVTGQPLALKDLLKLHWHKNADGEYHCPVLKKVFTEFTNIVAVKTTGNVFSYDAIKELNVKPKNWRELLTDEPFTRADLITLQDPNNLNANLLTDFDHVKKGLAAEEPEGGKALGIVATASISRVLSELPEKGAEALKLGGGGGKAQREAAAALAALEAEKKAREEERRRAQERKAAAAAAAGSKGQTGAEGKGEVKNGDGGSAEPTAKRRKVDGSASAAGGEGASTAAGETPPSGNGTAGVPAMSVVDMASAAVVGRSASAAKAKDEKKARANVAAYVAGARTPVAENTKLVKSAYTSGSTTRGFTSTVYAPATETEFEMVRVEKKPKKKGYCRIHTTVGDLNVELHCDIVPRTCENFLTLAERGYFDGTVFHRSIRNFMIQGGDPTGTGKGGQSIWGKPFADEFDSRLLHSGRGVLSMANSGPHSNGSQFFILYKSAAHLNYKHAVFGRVVGGLETINAMEKVPTDDEDRPLREIKIEKMTVFVNPYTEPDEENEEKKEVKTEEELRREEEEGAQRGRWFSGPEMTAVAPKPFKSGVGKYLNPERSEQGQKNGAKQSHIQGTRSSKATSYGNFDNW